MKIKAMDNTIEMKRTNKFWPKEFEMILWIKDSNGESYKSQFGLGWNKKITGHRIKNRRDITKEVIQKAVNWRIEDIKDEPKLRDGFEITRIYVEEKKVIRRTVTEEEAK